MFVVVGLIYLSVSHDAGSFPKFQLPQPNEAGTTSAPALLWETFAKPILGGCWLTIYS